MELYGIYIYMEYIYIEVSKSVEKLSCVLGQSRSLGGSMIYCVAVLELLRTFE